jgi:hypothetical protein
MQQNSPGGTECCRDDGIAHAHANQPAASYLQGGDALRDLLLDIVRCPDYQYVKHPPQQQRC